MQPSDFSLNISHHQAPAPSAWESRCEEWCKQGGELLDKAVQTLMTNAGDEFRAIQLLQQWGVANATDQVMAWKVFKDLPAEDPLHKLQNLQRVALMTGKEASRLELLDIARTMIREGRASLICASWVKAVSANLLHETRTVAAPRMPVGQQLIGFYQKENQELRSELEEAYDVIAKLKADLEDIQARTLVVA